MKFRILFPVILVALFASLILPSSVIAAAYPDLIPLPVGWQPEGIALGRGHTFYSGSLATGSVLRGDLRTGETQVLVPPFGAPTVGLKLDDRSNILFAAGGPTGRAYAFDANTGETLRVFQLTSASSVFINDVIVTREAAYFTNSSLAEFYRIPLGPGGRLPSATTVETIPLSGDWVQMAGFNANGIEASANGKWLLIINSTTGTLYRVNPTTGVATAVDLGGKTLVNGDGIVLRGRTLFVVQNVDNQISVVKLSPDFTSGVVVDVLTSPNFGVPTTAFVFRNGVYAVNSHFGAADPTTTSYEVVQVDIK